MGLFAAVESNHPHGRMECWNAGILGVKTERDHSIVNNSFKPIIDELVKSPLIVMPDLIRHPEHIDFTGFRRSPE